MSDTAKQRSEKPQLSTLVVVVARAPSTKVHLISTPPTTANMPAVNTLVARDALNQLAKRNWPKQEPGLMAVFVICGLVAIVLVGIYFFKWNNKRKARAQTQQI
ncbi:hypothetical protein VD0001_g3121 [Verticillium dahliae]|nr:hypothetical protein VD0001_g3121 [Verticillium dahliae]